jgi:hypothetical protein
LTGDLIPKQDLREARRKKAKQTIEDLRLNDGFHQKGRLGRIEAVSRIVSLGLDANPHLRSLLEEWADRRTELSSITRFVLYRQGYSLDA